MRRFLLTFFAVIFCVAGIKASPAVAVNGKLPGAFSVSATKKVWFSQGNLQYQASSNTWRFAEHQYDYIGDNAGNNTAEANLATQSAWIDFFGWGTGNNPNNVSLNNDDYSTFIDWGTNAISNGGNTANQWRTLTNDEWGYLFNTRTTTSGIRYAKATVNGIAGLIILPDNWSTSYYTLSNTNSGDAAFTSNSISSANWTNSLEAHGAVFLPASGSRGGTIVYEVGTWGYYWSSTANSNTTAFHLFFRLSQVVPQHSVSRGCGLPVRLVSETGMPASITAAPSAKTGLSYTGIAQALVNAGTASGGTMNYSTDNSTWRADIPTAINAGNYTVYYKVVGDANHADFVPSSNTVNVTIAKVPITRVVTITNNKYVSIAPGNLQYKASTDTWRFAEHQYDFLGANAGNTAPSASQTAWMDLFGWGTSGWNNGQRYMYQPYSTSTNYYDYGVKNPKTADEALTGDYANGDWGVYNSAQLGQGWRTLTRDECRYMIYSRTTTGTVNSTANAIFTNAKILTDGSGTDGLTYNICGVILFPDNFDGSAAYSGVTWGTINSPSDWSTTCTTAGWAALEAAGCVFLPAAGSRSGTEVTSAGTWGIYWTSTASAVEYVDDVYIGPSTFSAFGGNYRYLGRSVRLAQDIATAPAAVEGLVYIGSAQDLITAGTTNVGIMKYSLDSSSWSEEIPTAINNGDYIVYFMVEGDANHENFTPTNNSIAVTIGKPNYTISGNADPQHPDTYYSTFYYSLFKYVIPEGVEAYAATIGESDLYLKKIAGAGDVLPEGTAVILKSTVRDYTMVPTDDAAITITEPNALQGVDESTAAPANCYVLSGHSSDNSVTGVGFYQYTGELKAHKAYVVVGNNAPKRMRFVFDTETGVESAQSSEVSVQKILRDGQLIIIRGDREFNVQGQIIK